MKQILSIARSRSDLTVTMLCAEPPDVTLLESPEDAGLLNFPALYQRETCSLDACDALSNDRHRQLRRSWQALQSVVSMNADTLFHVYIVLLETIAVPEDASLSLLLLERNWDTIAPIRTPTAAHPRAYRGTKYQPPKPAVPEISNLRPYLCHSESLQLILTRLRPFRRETAIRLQRSGYEADRLKPLGMFAEGQEAVDAAISATIAAEAGTSRLPADFRRFLLPLLQGREQAQVKSCLALYWKLELHADEALLCAFAHLVHLQNNVVTLCWGEVFVCLPAEWRVSFTCLLAYTQAYRVDPRNLPRTVLKSFGEMDAQPYPVYRLYCLLLGLTRNVDGDYLLVGFELANAYHPKRCFYHVEQSGSYPLEAVERCTAYMRSAFSATYEDTPLLMWDGCGVLPGFGKMLAQTDWSRFAPDVARAYVQLFTNGLWQEWTLAQKIDCWRWLRQIKPQLDWLLEQTPAEYQPKCLLLLRECAWEWGETPKTRGRLTNALALIERVCRPPFRKRSNTANAIAILALHLEEDICKDLLRSPDSSLVRLEEACASENSATLVEAGLETLAAITPAWMARAFTPYAAKLCRVSRLLGCFSDAMRAQIIREFAQELALLPNLSNLNLEDACALLETISATFGKNLVPDAIQKHLEQNPLLSAERLAHYRQDMENRLLLAQLEMLERNALQAMRAGFEDAVVGDREDAAVHHALQMRCHSDRNRRGFRKFLRAYLSGGKDYLRLHPCSQAWLQRHPRLNPNLWLEGIAFPAVFIEGIGTIHIGVETEPLEALRMGTYMGSCLGLGGSFAYSAVANMLDINKQVVYARNKSGRVLARQLVAVSEENQLVCYEVYPGNVAAPTQRLFRDYDTQWAEALGLPLYDAKSADKYDIAHVLSQNWWDDYAWNLEIEELSLT